jgi:hypothetical protein
MLLVVVGVLLVVALIDSWAKREIEGNGTNCQVGIVAVHKETIATERTLTAEEALRNAVRVLTVVRLPPE